MFTFQKQYNKSEMTQINFQLRLIKNLDHLLSIDFLNLKFQFKYE